MHAAPRTLVELARARAEELPTSGYRFLGDGVHVSETLDYVELDLGARAIATALRDRGVQPGDRALLLYLPGLEFVRAFFGCLYAGAVAVPVPAPNPARLSRTLPRLRAIARDSGLDIVLTSSALEAAAVAMRPMAPELATKTWLATETCTEPAHFEPPPLTPDSLALLQYTSGSTGTPRGVGITHRALLHNMEVNRAFVTTVPEMVMVSWLPVYHDMGLIGGMLTPMLGGWRVFMMSPLEFLQDPVKWLQALTKHRGTVTGAPNFALDLATRKVTDAQLEQLDLRALKVLFCGAEPIRLATLERFSNRFARAGFDGDAIRPCYGLAEATLTVSRTVEGGPRSWKVDGAALRAHRVVHTTDADAYVVVDCGDPADGVEIAIVDDQGRRCPPDRVGEIWIQSPCMGEGYWQRPEDTEQIFGARLADGSGPWLRTGDLGFVAPGGGLCITGRVKDVIIIRGRNHYPQDIEHTVEQASPHLRKGGSAAFGLHRGDTEELVVVAEADLKRAGRDTRWDDVIDAVRSAVGEEHELSVHAVALIEPGQLPKTPSGKVMRGEARELYTARAFDLVKSWSAPAEARAPLGQGHAGRTREDIERFLLDWLGRHLGRPIPADATFAALGLDSLELVTLTDALREYLNQPSLSAASMLNFPSVRSLSEHLVEAHAAPVEPVAPPALVRTGSEGVLSYSQEAVLAWEARRPPSHTWTETVRVRLRGLLDRARLNDAVRRVVERQDALRQLFVRGRGAVGTCSVFDVPVHVVDASGHGDEAVEEIYQQIASTPLDLDGSPLLHVHLLARSSEDHHLVLRWHQLVHGGTDGALLLGEILETYAALVEGRPARLPDLPVRFTDHAAWERSYFDGVGRPEVLAAQQRLEGAKPLPLPLDRERAGAPGIEPVGARFALDPEASEAFTEMCKAEAVTLFVGVTTIMGIVLARWCGVEETVVMSPSSTRSRPEIRSLAGKFGAWTPTRMSLAGAPTLRELMAQVRAQVAFGNAPVPGPLLYGTTDVFGHPLNRVVVNVPSQAGSPTTLPSTAGGLTVESEPTFKPFTTRTDVELVATRRGGRIVGRLTAGRDQFDQETIEAKLADLVRLLQTLRPESPCGA